MIDENEYSEKDDDGDEVGEDELCPFCEKSDCEHFVLSINLTDGGIEGGRMCPDADALWAALDDAVDRAASGGELKNGKVSKTLDELLMAARKYGINSETPDDAAGELTGDILYAAQDILDRMPGTYNKRSVGIYGGFTAEDALELYWAPDPKKFAEDLREKVEAIRLSVGEAPDDQA